jgi:hypothetical protein
MFLTSGLSPTTGVYISIFKVVLAGNKRPIELRYEMDIVMFNLLFKLQIHSSCVYATQEKVEPLRTLPFRSYAN